MSDKVIGERTPIAFEVRKQRHSSKHLMNLLFNIVQMFDKTSSKLILFLSGTLVKLVSNIIIT